MKSLILKKGTMFGAATSSFQIEGGHDADGKSESIWDRFCLNKENIEDASDGKIACDHYHHYEEDVKLLKKMNIQTYRFSISWSRILPNGVGQSNSKGIQFYHNLIDCLIKNGIEPVITMYHWDLPQCLQNKGGFMNEESIEWFKEYAKIILDEYSSKVKYFITFNEPHAFCFAGYNEGTHAPGYRCLKTTLQVSHNVLKAHGEVVKMFRQNRYKAKIGICCDMAPVLPLRESDKDVASLYENMHYNWFVDAVLLGEYPLNAFKYYDKGEFAPNIKDGDMELISTPCDFFAINYYRCDGITNIGGVNDLKFKQVFFGGHITDIGWEVIPEGILKSLKYVDSCQKGIEIIVAENGCAVRDMVNVDGQILDYERVDYMYRHIEQCKIAQECGINLTKYYAWSFMDNFEWACGYSKRFGIVWIDFKTNKRIVKESGKFYANLIKENEKYYINK